MLNLRQCRSIFALRGTIMKHYATLFSAAVLALSMTCQVSADIVVNATQGSSGGQSFVRFEGSGSINTNALVLAGSDFSFNAGVQSASNFPQLNMGTYSPANGKGYEVSGPNNFGTGSPFRFATTWTGPDVFALRKGADPNTKIYFVTANNYVSGSSLTSSIEFSNTTFLSLGMVEDQSYVWNFSNGETFTLQTQGSLGGPGVPEPGSALVCAIFAGGFITRVRRR